VYLKNRCPGRLEEGGKFARVRLPTDSASAVGPPDRPNSAWHLWSGKHFINSITRKGTKRRREFVPIVIWSCPRHAKPPQ